MYKVHTYPLHACIYMNCNPNVKSGCDCLSVGSAACTAGMWLWVLSHQTACVYAAQAVSRKHTPRRTAVLVCFHWYHMRSGITWYHMCHPAAGSREQLNSRFGHLCWFVVICTAAACGNPGGLDLHAQYSASIIHQDLHWSNFMMTCGSCRHFPLPQAAAQAAPAAGVPYATYACVRVHECPH